MSVSRHWFSISSVALLGAVLAASACGISPAAQEPQAVTQCPDQTGPAKKVCTGDSGCNCGGIWTSASKATCATLPGCTWTTLTLNGFPDNLRQLATSQSAAATPLCNTNPGCYEDHSSSEPVPPGDCVNYCCSKTYKRYCKPVPPPTDMPQPLDAIATPDLSEH